MSKSTSYKAKRAERPSAQIAARLREEEAQRRKAGEIMRDIATASANDHSDRMETAVSVLLTTAEDAGVNVYAPGTTDQRDLVAIVAEIDETTAAQRKRGIKRLIAQHQAHAAAEAIGEVLTHKHAAEALEGYRIML